MRNGYLSVGFGIVFSVFVGAPAVAHVSQFSPLAWRMNDLMLGAMKDDDDGSDG